MGMNKVDLNKVDLSYSRQMVELIAGVEEPEVMSHNHRSMFPLNNPNQIMTT